MFRRRPRPLVRAAGLAAGTAVVVGTAGAVHHHQQQKYTQQDYAQQQAYQQQAAPPPAAPPPPAPAPQAAATDLTTQLQQLGELHTAGVLSDEEFAAAKAKLLAS